MLSHDQRRSASRSGSKMMHGGYADAPSPTTAQRDMFDALVDTLIPPEDGWPSAAELTLADLALTYLVPDDVELSFYPHLRVRAFFDVLDAQVTDLPRLSAAQRTQAVAAFEAAEPDLFRRVLEFVYYIYYGHGDVVENIRQRTRHGKDFHGRPQRVGYDAVLENWGERRPGSRGAFIPTESVVRAPQARKAAV